MILGTRAARGPQFTGMNVFLLRDWVLPADSLGLGSFKTFDEALSKMRSDADATRIVPLGLASLGPAADLNTATEAVFRNLPERHRGGADFYTLAVVRTAEGRKIVANLPPWASIHVEKSDGEVDRLTRAANWSGWFACPLDVNDAFVHLSLFTEEFSARLNPVGEPRFRRLSRAIEEARRNARLAPALSVGVTNEDDEV